MLLIKKLLEQPGVYVLYWNDRPYYIGKATKKLGSRISAHANRPNTKYYNFWNFFSAFVVPDKKYIGEVESLLIAATPSENRAEPKIPRIKLPDLSPGRTGAAGASAGVTR
jgi:hypothetical protein